MLICSAAKIVCCELEANRSRQGHPGTTWEQSWHMPIGAGMQAFHNSDGGHISIGGNGSKILPYVCITLGFANLGRDSCFSARMFSHHEIRFQFKQQKALLWRALGTFYSSWPKRRGVWSRKKPKESFGWTMIFPFHSPPQGLPSSSDCLSWGQRFITFKNPLGKS